VQEILLRTAIDLFHRKGYSGTTIREVGTKAGVSNSLLYHYFKNKEEMLFQIIQSTSQDLLESLKEIDRKVEDPWERLREMLIQHIVMFGIKRKKESKIVVEEHYWLKGQRKATIYGFQRQIHDLYMKNLKDLEARGEINGIELHVINFSLFGIINWFFKWYKEGRGLKPEEVAENILKLLFHGMAKPGKGSCSGEV
jgi:AcrR family transcriptional regulator